MTKSRIYWKVEGGREHDIPEHAVIVVENGTNSVKIFIDKDGDIVTDMGDRHEAARELLFGDYKRGR